MNTESTPEEVSDRQGIASFALLASLYAASVAAYRLPDILAVQGAELLPDFPPWIFGYLLVLCASLLVLALAAGVHAGLAMRAKAPPAAFGLAIAVTIAALVVVHGYVLIAHDAAVSDGGMLWGFVHVLTMTREVAPGGPTDAGMAGYRVGQAVGVVAMLLWPLSIVALSRPPVSPPRR